MFSSPAALRAKALGLDMTPAWGNGLKDFAPSIGSAEELKQYIAPTDFRMQLAVFENRHDAVETLEYLKPQDVPYKKRKPGPQFTKS